MKKPPMRMFSSGLYEKKVAVAALSTTRSLPSPIWIGLAAGAGGAAAETAVGPERWVWIARGTPGAAGAAAAGMRVCVLRGTLGGPGATGMAGAAIFGEGEDGGDGAAPRARGGEVARGGPGPGETGGRVG